MTIYVSLDLGSESMAACFAVGGDSKMIELQRRAAELLDVPPEKEDDENEGVDFLKDDIPTERSPRLRNRISLRDGKQPQTLPDEHARLIFSGIIEYEQSLFKIFHKVGAWPGREKVIPNPKILFQHQAGDILSEVEASSGGNVDLSAQTLINHLTLQIVNNFVLNSQELSKRKNDDIHLTITIPNIYSLVHADSIKKFIKDNTSVHTVEVLSESDVVAYYPMGVHDSKDPEDLTFFKEKIQQILARDRRLCIVTFDVGKGTTDLSCILIENPKDDLNSNNPQQPRRLTHTVQGKTGKSTGGNYLNYLFAEYYNSRLLENAAAIEEETSKKIPFGFLSEQSPSLKRRQNKAAFELNTVIETVKRNITKNYEVDYTTLSPEIQKELLVPVVDAICTGINVNFDKDEFKLFRQRLFEIFILPKKLERMGWKKMLPFSQPLPTENLKNSIERYVEENVEGLLDGLKLQVEDHQPRKLEARKILFTRRSEGSEGLDSNSMVIISGQASQFKPLRQAILDKCSKLGISGENLYKMGGKDSKEACCKGVINFNLAGALHLNPTELHGTYGCLSATAPEEFKPFDMREIKNGGSSSISFDLHKSYYVVFTPRSYEETKVRPPYKNDGFTAVIRLIEDNTFTLSYDKDNLKLWLNGAALELATFGNTKDLIYPKVWPEILDPNSKR